MNHFAALLAFVSGSALVETRDFVYVSGIYGTDANYVLKQLAGRLKSAGFGLHQVASANLYLTDPSALQQVEDAWRRAFPRQSPARTVLLATLPDNNSLCLSVVVSRKPIRMVTGGGVFTAGTLFLPGLVSNDLKGAIDAQTQDVMSQQEAILEAAGLMRILL